MNKLEVRTVLLWQPLVTMTNNHTSNKSLSRISSGDHKRTRQEVFAVLLSYLYKLYIVYATNNYSCPNVYMLFMSVLCVHYEIVIQLTCSLISSIQTTLVHFKPMTSHYVTSHVTTVSCTSSSSIKTRKRNSKEKKYNVMGCQNTKQFLFLFFLFL